MQQQYNKIGTIKKIKNVEVYKVFFSALNAVTTNQKETIRKNTGKHD